ncbi:MAG: ABC transporter ATP-binding protein [Bacteroidia bacterium]|nr:ABC transporter ATP-binding protein [Bacteroidia bacterium]
MLVEAKNIVKTFGNVAVLKGINMAVNASEIVAIVGASGAGKTTLLQILGTLDTADTGQLWIEGELIQNLSSKKLAQVRNKKIGFVFQFHNLLPEFTAVENICIPAFIGGTPKREAEAKAMQLLDFLKLTHRANHKPGALSGGEQQRIAVARSLINNPMVILADEPSGNLDSANAAALHQLFFDLRNAFKQTFVIVTHNQSLAAMADKVVTISDGVVI